MGAFNSWGWFLGAFRRFGKSFGIATFWLLVAERQRTETEDLAGRKAEAKALLRQSLVAMIN